MAEGAAGTIFFIAIAVPIGIFFSDVAAAQLCQAQASHIANQACKVANSRKYWLGMRRPGYTESAARAEIEEVANTVCNTVGMGFVNATVAFDDRSTEFDLTVCELNFNAIGKIPFRLNVFGFDLAQLFPGNVHVKSVAARAKITQYAVLEIDAPSPSKNAIDPNNNAVLNQWRDVVTMPVYGYFQDVPVLAAPYTDTTPGTAIGYGLADMSTAENFFAYNLQSVQGGIVQDMVKNSPPNYWWSWPVSWNPAKLETK